MHDPTLLSSDGMNSGPTVLLTPARLSPLLAVLREPASPAAEQYRFLAHSLERTKPPYSSCTIAVTSAVENEGKTITALNLAFALSESRAGKIVLCDLDLRGGKVALSLGLGDAPGIMDVLEQRKTAAEVLRRVDKNLAILPSGAPVAHPLGLLRSPSWQSLSRSLRKHFDYVILDCPPICVTDDMAVIDDVVDRVLLVVRSEQTTSELVREALGKISPSKALGFVLNDADLTGTRSRSYKRKI